MKLNNLSRLTALLLALTMFLSSVAWADPVAEGDYTADNYAEMLADQTGTCAICVMENEFPTTDHNGNTISITCGYEYLENLGSPMERYHFLNYHYQQVNSAALSALYSVHTQHVEAGAENLWCNCAEYWSDFKEPGAENHKETCPWVDDTVVIIPNIPQPPVYGGDPQGKQYTSNEEYDLPMAGDRAIILPEGGRAVIHSNVEAADGYQWQVYDGTQWVGIAGETGSDLVITTAKLNTIFELTGIAELRYFDKDSNIVLASVSVTSQEIAGGEYVEPVAEAAQNLSLTERADGDATTTGPYTITVYYYYENTQTPVYQASTATFPADTDINWPVTFPTVVGYEPFFADETATSSSHTFTGKLTENKSYVVSYKPADVGFKVLHYQQNLADDKYTVFETVEYHPGYTNAAVPATGLEKEYEGFQQLPYSTTGLVIAADGSTVVEIYYDRNYCLMNFELNGGYGVEPIYAKYGSDTSNVGTPQRAGYSFQGWAATADGQVDTTLPPATMPAGHVTYYAVWKEYDTAKVSIVIWGENADDEGYSYYDTIDVNLKPGTQFTYNPNGSLICALEEGHVHSAACGYGCGETEHSHTESCYMLTCTQSVHTTHTTACYQGTTSTTRNPSTGMDGAQTVNGYVHNHWYYNELIYINGTWYEYNGSTSAGSIAPTTCHTHTDYAGSCYTLTCTQHTHSDSCYACGKVEHTHTDDCYMSGAGMDSNLWTFIKSDTVTVAADGSTVVNVYYDRTSFTLTFIRNGNTLKTINKKWGADIHSEFPIKENDSTIWWYVPEDCESLVEGNQFGSLETMPSENITFTQSSLEDEVEIIYYVEILEGETADYTHTDGKKFKQYKVIKLQKNCRLTYTEEFHNIVGFKQFWSDPEFDKMEQGGVAYDGYSNREGYYIKDENLLCYTRNKFDIVYYNPTDLIKTIEDVPYETSLNSTTYNWTPTTPPDKYEPGSVTFAGWYLNPECTGDPFDFTTETMPAGPNNTNGEVALSLYAKWEPVTYTVNFYLTDEKYALGPENGIYIPDNTYVDDLTGQEFPYGSASFSVKHGDYIAQQYVEANLDYTAMNEAKPNGNLIFVYWKYLDAETNEWKTFNPTSPVRRNMDLIGVWSSNTLVTYTVNFVYKNGTTETVIADAINGSAMATTTKTFDAKGGTALYDGYQTGYFPVVPSHSITMDLDETKNVFTFEYVKADNVPYSVFYLAETLKDGGTSLDTKDVTHVRDDGTTYVKTYYMIAVTDKEENNTKSVVTVPYKHVDGYLPDAYQKSLVLSVNADGTPNTAANEIYFFYTVNEKSTSYKVYHYIEDPNGTVTNDKDTTVRWSLYTGIPNNPETKPGEIGTPVAEAPQSIPYYKYDASISTAEGTPKGDATLELKLYYRETTATINYVPVGPDGGQWDGTGTTYVTGTTDTTSETVKKVTGTAVGATATPATNEYKFVGWYNNAACEGKPISTEAEFVPTKTPEQVWPDSTTYYAKFDWNVADLTITKKFSTLTDVPEQFKNMAFTVKVSLPVGEYDYTVTDATSTVESRLNVTNETGEVNGTADLFIKAGQTIVIKGIQIGSNYSVQELKPSYFDVYGGVSGSNVTLDVDEPPVNLVNFYKSGKLSITKKLVVADGVTVPEGTKYPLRVTLTSDTSIDGEYSYTVNGTTQQATFEGGVATINLAADETATLTLPTGVRYFVSEAETNDYYPYYPSGTQEEIVALQGTIGADTESKVTLTNVYKYGNLKITKTVTGENAPGGKFSFIVTLGDKTITGTYGDASFVNGVATVELDVASGETKTATITGLPGAKVSSNSTTNIVYGGTTYTVEEVPVAGYVSSPVMESGLIVAAETATAFFTNDYTVGNLSITKNVITGDGISAPANDEFEITVSLTAAAGAVLAESYLVNGESKNVTFLNEDKTSATLTPTLKDGETAKIENIQTGTTYSVEENEEHYTPSYSPNAQGTIVEDETAAVTVTNTYRYSKLTIRKTGMEPGESAIFKVTAYSKYNNDQETTFTVSVPNDGDVTIGELLIGYAYTITEIGSWSNRYAVANPVTGEIDENGSVVTISNTGKNNQWLHDEDYVHNDFSTPGDYAN